MISKNLEDLWFRDIYIYIDRVASLDQRQAKYKVVGHDIRLIICKEPEGPVFEVSYYAWAFGRTLCDL